MLLFFNQNFVNHTVFFGLFACHPVISIAVFFYFFVRLSTVQRDDVVQFFFQFCNLFIGNFYFRNLSLCAAHRLMKIARDQEARRNGDDVEEKSALEYMEEDQALISDAAVARAYTLDSRWRNRSTFLQGRAAIEAFLAQKWQRELDYRLIKELWAFTGSRIAVRFAYEWHDDSGHWYRSYGNENWEFNDDGLMAVRHASINDRPIQAVDRLFFWPLGRRPDDHPGLSDLGL